MRRNRIAGPAEPAANTKPAAALPSRSYVELIETYSLLVPRSTERLRFLRFCWHAFAAKGPFPERPGRLGRWRLRAVTLESLWRASRKAVRALSATDALLLRCYRLFPRRGRGGPAARRSGGGATKTDAGT